MKALINLPAFVKALILSLIIVQLFCIMLSIALHYNLYTSPFPYFISFIMLFVMAGIGGEAENN